MVEKVTEFKVLGVVLDTKVQFKSHIRSIDASESSKLAIMRKALCLLSDPVLVFEVLSKLLAALRARVLFSYLDVFCSFSSWSS